jgi:peptidoglycan/LPS O-acetylase OafA/YrhL
MLVLIVALWVVFFGGLAPSDRSEANRPELVVPSLQVNQFVWLSNPTATEQWPSQILALRDASGALHTWEIPII